MRQSWRGGWAVVLHVFVGTGGLASTRNSSGIPPTICLVQCCAGMKPVLSQTTLRFWQTALFEVVRWHMFKLGGCEENVSRVRAAMLALLSAKFNFPC